MAQKIARQYPGKSAQEIYEKVHAVMANMAKKANLKYETDAASKTGKVSGMGVNGGYVCKDGSVEVDVAFPFIFPMKGMVTGQIEKKLDGLFA